MVGACPGNGQKHNLVFSTAGVYVGPDNPLNCGFTLIGLGANNQKAELQAAIKGLKIAGMIEDMQYLGSEKGMMLVMKTDSTYVYGGVSDWIKKW